MTEVAEQTERKTGRFLWPTLILVLLIGHITILTTAAIIASSDPSVAAEPDYYQKALAWDKIHALSRDPAEDGYEWRTTLGPDTNRPGNGILVFELSRDGSPVSDAEVSATIFPVVRSRNRQDLTLSEREPGVYTAPATLNRNGRWEVRLELTTPERTYRFIRSLSVTGAVQ